MADNKPAQKPAEQSVAKTDDNNPIRQTAWLVQQYAKKLLDDRRAGQFATTLAIISKRDPKIAICTQESLLAAMMACVHLDLIPNTPEQLAYIIPYRNNRSNQMEAQFQLGYKGMADLAYRTGQIASISAELVFPEDTFKVTLGTDRKLIHEPSFDRDRTKLDDATHVYATAQLNNKQTAFEVLSISEIQKVRDSVKVKSTAGPWNTWGESMAKKTAVKRLLKLLPASKEDNRLQFASMFDSWAEAGKLGVDQETGEIIEAKERGQEAKRSKAIAEKVEQAKAVKDEKAAKVDDKPKDKPEEKSDAQEQTNA